MNKRGLIGVIVFGILGLMLLGLVSGASVGQGVLKKFNEGEEMVKVIVSEKDVIQPKGLFKIKSPDNGIKRISKRGYRNYH